VPTAQAYPQLTDALFVATNATVIGDVSLGKEASIWYSAVLRGDLHKITVGDRSILQDRVVIKKTGSDASPVLIGRDVFVGPNSKIGACTLQDFSYVSMGCTVEDGCVLESYSMLAAGAVLSKGTRVPSGQIFAGSPAKYLRDVTAEERETIHEHLFEQRNLAVVHAEESEKSFEQIFLDDLERENSFFTADSERLSEKLEQAGLTTDPMDVGEQELVKGLEYHTINEREATETRTPDMWKPFTEDAAVFPESWKVYGQDMDRYERAKKLFERPVPRRPVPELVPKLPRDLNPWTKRY
jgi:carbonic anhydrase/acetyltransferase-like protein (isoleucine patch superfamily)